MTNRRFPVANECQVKRTRVPLRCALAALSFVRNWVLRFGNWRAVASREGW